MQQMKMSVGKPDVPFLWPIYCVECSAKTWYNYIYIYIYIYISVCVCVCVCVCMCCPKTQISPHCAAGYTLRRFWGLSTLTHLSLHDNKQKAYSSLFFWCYWYCCPNTRHYTASAISASVVGSQADGTMAKLAGEQTGRNFVLVVLTSLLIILLC